MLQSGRMTSDPVHERDSIMHQSELLHSISDSLRRYIGNGFLPGLKASNAITIDVSSGHGESWHQRPENYQIIVGTCQRGILFPCLGCSCTLRSAQLCDVFLTPEVIVYINCPPEQVFVAWKCCVATSISAVLYL